MLENDELTTLRDDSLGKGIDELIIGDWLGEGDGLSTELDGGSWLDDDG